MIRRSLAWMVIVAVLVSLGAPALAQQTGTPAPAAPKPPAKPAAAKDKSASGTVKSATATSLVLVAPKDKKEWTFALTKDTKITRGDKAVGIKDIAANETVTVTYAEANGKMTAKTVKLRAATAAAKPKP